MVAKTGATLLTTNPTFVRLDDINSVAAQCLDYLPEEAIRLRL